jgi:hypothetical protein
VHDRRDPMRKEFSGRLHRVTEGLHPYTHKLTNPHNRIRTDLLTYLQTHRLLSYPHSYYPTSYYLLLRTPHLPCLPSASLIHLTVSVPLSHCCLPVSLAACLVSALHWSVSITPSGPLLLPPSARAISAPASHRACDRQRARLTFRNPPQRCSGVPSWRRAIPVGCNEHG